jgi:hypothetical protein
MLRGELERQRSNHGVSHLELPWRYVRLCSQDIHVPEIDDLIGLGDK